MKSIHSFLLLKKLFLIPIIWTTLISLISEQSYSNPIGETFATNAIKNSTKEGQSIPDTDATENKVTEDNTLENSVTESEGICLSLECLTGYHSNLRTISTNICQSTLDSPICEKVPKEDLKNCQTNYYNPVNQFVYDWNKFEGCATGVGQAIKDIFNMAWWLIKMPFSPAAREKWQTDVNDFKQTVDQFNREYFGPKYQRALKNHEGGSLSETKAFAKVTEELWAENVWPVVSQILSREIPEFRYCLSEKARARMMCLFFSEYFIPPAAFISLLKRGHMGLTVAQKARIMELLKDESGRMTIILKATEGESLRRQGFRPIYASGVDEVNDILDMGKGLRTRNIDPAKTHIPEFADQTDELVEFFKEGIQSRSKKWDGGDEDLNTEQRLAILDNIATEVKERINNKSMSYAQWVKLNVRLAALATTKKVRLRYGIENDFLTTGKEPSFTSVVGEIFLHIENNPDLETVFLPTRESLGIMAINKTTIDGIIPLGVTNKNKMTDGVDMEPLRHIVHDYTHYTSGGFGGGSLNKHLINKELHERFITKSRQLAQPEREKIEMVYFMLEHEAVKNVLNTSFTEQQLIEILRKQSERFLKKKNDLWEFLPDSVDNTDEDAIKNYLEESGKAYFRTVQNTT